MKRAVMSGVMAVTLAGASVGASADIGVNPKVGTLGLGVELSKGFGNNLSVGLALNSYDFTDKEVYDGVNYDFDLDFKTVGVLANWHPFGGVFRITAGAFKNDNKMTLTGTAGPGSVIGNVTLGPGQSASLSSGISFRDTAPYIGIGWGSAPGSSFGLTFDIGALQQGSPKVSLSQSGGVPITPADIELERQQLESELKDFKWYPVVALGLYFRF